MSAGPGAKTGGQLGRRIVAHFMLAASVPVLVLGLLAWSSYVAQSESHDQRQLDAELGAEAMRVFDRLLAARAGLRMVADGSEAEHVERPPGSVFRSLVPVGASATGTFLSAEAMALKDWWRIEAPPAGRSIHWRASSDGHAATVVLSQRDARNGTTWLAEVDAHYLWRDVFESLDSGPATVQDRAGRTLLANASTEPVMRPDGGAVLSSSRTLFLQKEFGADDWVFRAQRAHAPEAAFGLQVGGIVIKVVLAAILLVAILSLIQVRRTMDPLGRLVGVTRRLARQDYGARVQLTGDDEFRELGQAVNEMAEQMQGHVSELQMLSAIDRDILNAADTERLVLRVLTHLGELAPGASVAIVQMGSHEVGSLCAHVLDAAGTTRAVAIDAASALAFGGDAEHDAAGWLEPDAATNALLDRLGLPRTAVYRARASARGRLQAVLMIVMPDRTLDAPSWRRRIDELRHRVAVALSAAAHERRLNHDATHDSLSGLRNRAGLRIALDAALEAGRPFALMFADLDRFKGVNDSLGHHAGDELLRQAARRVVATLPAGTVVARPGGDEFVVLLDVASGCTPHDASQSICARLAEPFVVEGREIVLGASVGWTLYPDDGIDADTLARRADLAMYAAKEQGRGRAAHYEPSLGRAAEERAWVVNDLRRAVERGQLLLNYQPRVDATTGRAHSAEALVRWLHPQRGLVSPATFIPIAEETGAIREIGRWVLDEACRQMAAWQRDGVAIERVSVNLSPLQMAEATLFDEIVATLARHGVAPCRLELEITESAVIGDDGAAAELLGRLRRLGIAIALDDFGTGYSSMAYLSRMPVDVIKIDRAFVKGLGRDPSADGVTRAIVALAKSLRLSLVAEGVETVEQATALRAMGCDELQGFLYARPVLPADYARLACVAAPAVQEAGAAVVEEVPG